MSTEAFLWNYEDGEPIGFEFKPVINILSTDQTDWIGEDGCLRVWFQDPDDVVDVYLDREVSDSGHVSGIMIARPLSHPDFLDRVYEVMGLGNVVLFYSDDTTPIFRTGANLSHYPVDLLEELGEPKMIESVDQL